jgi:hypothetical protein
MYIMQRRRSNFRSKDTNWIEIINRSGEVKPTRLNEIIWSGKREEQTGKAEISNN